MRVSRLKTSLLFSFFLLTFLFITIPVRADDDDNDDSDDYDVKARVARISLIGGEVNLRRAGNKDWESGRVNYPLVEGDTIMTGKGSQLEVQIDSSLSTPNAESGATSLCRSAHWASNRRLRSSH